MIKPTDISTEMWDKSMKRAKVYLTRAYSVFPNKSKTFYMKKVDTFIRADISDNLRKGVK